MNNEAVLLTVLSMVAAGLVLWAGYAARRALRRHLRRRHRHRHRRPSTRPEWPVRPRESDSPDAASDTAASLPPGWYPDPVTDRGRRYWDGSTWTDQHRA